LILFTTILCIATAFLIGTRFIIGFIMTGIVFIMFRGFSHISRKQIIFLSLAVLFLLIMQGGMKMTRGTGLKQASFEEAVENKTNLFLSAEGLLRINAMIMKYKPYNDPESPIENLFILIYWIPRIVWQSKPTLGGDWFHKKYLGTTGMSETHSFSGGFSMPALLDFGPVGGALFCTIYGILLAIMERIAERYRTKCQAGVIIPALLYFGVFFMMRSLFTSLIVIINIVISVVLPFWLFEKMASQEASCSG
jgi:oligosaccharide repeat unit polymerase